MPFEPNLLTLYPSDPGVYLMKNQAGVVLYVGKAKNLRSRLKQYFGSSRDAREMIPYLLAQVEAIDTIIALTEKDALILENSLIKRHQPKYNILLKDDKSHVGIVLTAHTWPMLRLVRNQDRSRSNGMFFGPYPSAFAARQTLELLQKLFPLRQCSDAEFAVRKRPCLLYDIRRCIAPCMDLCSQQEYQQYVKSAVRLLKGQNKEVLKSLEASMHEASEQLDFEKAQSLLETIRQIEHVTSAQHIEDPHAKDSDVIGFYREGDALLLVVLQLREGRIAGSEHFSFFSIVSEDEEVLETFLLQHYQAVSHLPSEIFLPFPLSKKSALQEILSESVSKKLTILTPQRGKKSDLIEMASRNAKALFKRVHDEHSLREKMLLDLQETLKLTRFPRRIECIDTSNISGTDPVASLVCFINGEKDRSETRLFRIKTTEKSDDYTSMKEVLLRHFSKQKEKNIFCDLLILDGGKGQLNLALEVFQELEIASVDLIGLTKEDARHDRGLTQEKIYLPYRKDPLFIEKTSPLLFLLQRIRDEAHRMAIKYHRKRRSKRTLRSELDDLKGIGPKKKQRILAHFGSIRNLKRATKEELEKVSGLTKRDRDTLRSLIQDTPDLLP